MTAVDIAEIWERGILVTSAFYAALCVGAIAAGRKSRLPPSAPSQTKNPPVSVVIAARDEATNLGDCLDSILAQHTVQQVIVVDDQSSDATAAVATSIASRDPRVAVMSNPTLPPGWTGKTLALHTGARSARSPLILFCDADVLLTPGVVEWAARTMERDQLDHLSGHFYVLCRTTAEHLCAPILVCISSISLFGTAGWLGAATGAFNMVRATTYWRHGGHEPIRGEVVDDVALARHLRLCGARSQFVELGDQIKVRLFSGLPGFLDAVSRSSMPFLRVGGVVACALALLFVTLMLWTVSGLFLPAAAYLMAGPDTAITTGARHWIGTLPYGLGLLAVWAAGRFTNARRLCRLFYPLAAVALGYGVFKAGIARMRGKPILWRGRVYPANRAENRS
jgi:hypothetical protein